MFCLSLNSGITPILKGKPMNDAVMYLITPQNALVFTLIYSS